MDGSPPEASRPGATAPGSRGSGPTEPQNSGGAQSRDPAPAGPGSLSGRARRGPWLLSRVLAVTAVVIVAGGVVATFWRPLAPAISSPPAATAWFADDLLGRVAAYRSPLRVVSVCASIVAALGPLTAVVWSIRRDRSRGRPRFPDRASTDRASRGLSGRMRRQGAGVRAAAVTVAVVAAQDLLLLPIRFWAGFMHAGAYGLRTQGLAGWFGDQILAMVPRWLGAAVVAAGVVWLVRRLPRLWPLAAGVALAALSGLLVLTWPFLMEPLRFDVTPLPQGPTRAAVEEVVDGSGLGGTPLLVADASRRTTARNAYVSGVAGTRRIVLYDTLLDLPDDEIAAVVAHEVAHQLHRDVLRGWAAGAAAAVVGCAVAGLAARVWQRRSGVSPAELVTRPPAVALLVAVALLTEVAVVPVTAWMSRRVEASADATALELVGTGEPFVDLQRSLVVSNLSDPAPPSWWITWRASHPTPAERMHRAVQY